MARFRVRQEADYVMGYLRYGHREGIIEANSLEEAKQKIEECAEIYLDLVVDDYKVEDVDYGNNEFEYEEI